MTETTTQGGDVCATTPRRAASAAISSASDRATRAVRVAVVLVGASFLVGLGAYGLLDDNEGLYAQVAREMLRTGDYVTPRWNGSLYLEKPPLLYWLVAASFAAFGEVERSARLVPAAASLGTALVLAGWVGRVRSALHGRLAALIFLTSAGALLLGRTLLFDVLLTLWTTSAVACLHLAATTGARRWSWLAGAAIGLGLLSKGLLAAAIPIGVVLAWTLWTRSFGALRRVSATRVALACVLVAGPWHVAASIATPQFAWFYFVNEHWLRFTGGRLPHDFGDGPWWFHVPRLLEMAFPWTFLVPAGIVAGARALRDDRAPRRDAPTAEALACLAFLVPLALFSAAGGKGNYYMIVGAPFLAVLGAAALLDRPATRPLIAIAAWVQAALVGAATVAAILLARRFESAIPAAATLLVGALVAASIVAVPRLRRPVPLAAAGCAFAWCVCAAVSTAGPALDARTSSRTIASHIRASRRAREDVVVRSRLERFSSLPFALDERVVECDGQDGDLEWGKRWEGGPTFVDVAGLAAWSAARASWLVVGDEKTPAWLARRLPSARLEPLW
jgi:4-amino-4-deoxy-L-arabinose transferase-like glycosyltransferase